MFDKRKEPESQTSASTPQPPSPRAASSTSAAVIGQSIKVVGTITGAEDLTIDGQIEGSVTLPDQNLTIGSSGTVAGNLRANVVRVDGNVDGDIDGAEKVVISRSGKVLGNIVAPAVTLEDGAKFKGSIDMDPAVEKQAPKKPAAVSEPAGAKADEDKTASAGQ